MNTNRTRTVIRTNGDVIATGISPQKATRIAMSLGAIPAGVYVIRGNVADAKAAVARIANPVRFTTDRIEAARMGVTL